MHALVERLQREPPSALEAELDRLYASLCDPETGDPDALGGPDLRQLVARLEHASRAAPNDAPLHHVLGEFLLASGLNGAAVTELRAASESGGNNSLLALALLRADQLEEVLEIQPRDARMLMIRTQAQEALGRFADAAATLRTAIAMEPDNLAAIVRLGLLQLWHGERSQATDWLQRATRIDPDAWATLRLRAEYSYATRDFAASEAAYDRLLAAGAPERYDPLPPSLGKARAQIYQGELRRAAATLDHAALPASDATLGYYRALLAFRAGDFRRAGELAEPLATRLGDFPPVHLLIGAAMLANGYPETAHRHLEQYVLAVPGNSMARMLLNDATARLADPDMMPPVATGALYAALGFAVP